MQARCYYFDALIRLEEIDNNNLRLEDNLEEFEDIFIKNQSCDLFVTQDR